MAETLNLLLNVYHSLQLGLPLLLLLLPLPWLVYRFARPVQRQQSALIVPFYAELPLNQQTSSPLRGKLSSWPLVIMTLIWVLTVLAATGPRWVGEPVELPVTGRDTMLAVDLSESMTVRDLQLHGHDADRLEVTKDVVSQFIKGRKGDRLGLILFGSNAYLQAPLTFDINTVGTLLEEATIGIAGSQTAIGDAIGLGVRQLRDRPKDQRVLIILTDGANTAGNISPIKAAELAAQSSVTIYTVGVGADEMVIPGLFGSSFGAQRINPSADLDTETLTKIANLTGGRYFRARSADDLQAIYRAINEMEPIELSKETFRPVKELFYWPLGLAILLALAFGLAISPLRNRWQGGQL